MQPRVVLGALGHGWLFLGLMFLDPIILRRLLDGAGADSAAAARRNLGYAAALSASMFVRVACMEVCFFGSVRAMNNCRTAIVPLVFRAAVGLRTDEDSGKLTNLMATDADKLGRWSWTLFFAAQWSFAVVSLPAVAYCMLGAAALVGAATVVAANQAALEIGKRTKPAVLRLQEARDARAKLTTEMLAGVRLAKLRGWTASVKARVAAAREAEMAALKTTRYLDALNVFVGCVAALAVPVAIFSWYALVEKKSLSPAVAFTALAWITQMEWSINTLPDIYNLWSSLSPSVERLAEFLLRAPKEPAAPPPFPSDAAAAVDGAVGYGARAVATAKFECRRGEVVAVVGPVGRSRRSCAALGGGRGERSTALAARLERSLLGLDGDEPERRRGGFIAYRDFVLYLDAFGSRASGPRGHRRRGVRAGLLALQTILLTLCALDASKTLHEKMLDGVLGAPLRFFDETPQGNALNRLQDLANVGVSVPTVFWTSSRTLTVASQLGLVLYFAPWVALMLPLALVPYGFIFSTVRRRARAARRRARPCYAHFNDALRGRETVAAFGALDRFCDANARLVEAMATGKYANDACSKWSQALTTMNGCFLYLAAGLCAVLLVRRGDVSTGQLGLVLLYAASLQRAGMDYMCGLATLEAQFVSVERVAEYCRLPRERDDGRGRAPAAPGSAAALVATDVALRYRLSRPLALRGFLAVAPARRSRCSAARAAASRRSSARSRGSTRSRPAP
ncbi:ATPase [Aureococcus anophagefferens]|nr:ATPase [Aureococcus anophagefferens]